LREAYSRRCGAPSLVGFAALATLSSRLKKNFIVVLAAVVTLLAGYFAWWSRASEKDGDFVVIMQRGVFFGVLMNEGVRAEEEPYVVAADQVCRWRESCFILFWDNPARASADPYVDEKELAGVVARYLRTANGSQRGFDCFPWGRAEQRCSLTPPAATKAANAPALEAIRR
jgi:hypothetical protein